MLMDIDGHCCWKCLFWSLFGKMMAATNDLNRTITLWNIPSLYEVELTHGSLIIGPEAGWSQVSEWTGFDGGEQPPRILNDSEFRNHQTVALFNFIYSVWECVHASLIIFLWWLTFLFYFQQVQFIPIVHTHLPEQQLTFSFF